VKARKPLSEELTHTVTYTDSYGKTVSFKSSEKLLKSHKILMNKNPYVKDVKFKKGI
jgi:hypothetical protein